ncbi:MAG TPA: hypothetical protein VH370_21110 [Humisphaera sp.]|jgi:hypothetical protein|nr:hypothetical protein [Humisphaera sp.]
MRVATPTRVVFLTMVVAGICIGAPTARATITITSRYHGTFDNSGANNGNPRSLGDIEVGRDIAGDGSVTQFHNYFLFDLSGISGQVTAATFTVTINPFFYESADASETLGLFDVSNSTIPALLNQFTTNDQATYVDLGSGNQYAAQVFTTAGVGTRASFDLDAAALADINNDLGLGNGFAIGGALTTIDNNTTSEAIFAFSRDLMTNSPPIPKLELTVVPESSMVMTVLVVCLIATASRSRRTHKRCSGAACLLEQR